MEKTFVINCEDIKHNIEVLKEKTGGKIIYAVLKGDAYGMGLEKFANEVYNSQIRHFAVTSLEDAIVLRKMHNDCEVLLLTPCGSKCDIYRALTFGVTFSVGSIENAENIAKIASERNLSANIHIKVDTGMGRYGFLPSQTDDITKTCALENIRAVGIFSHLHSAFNKKTEPSYEQFKIFKNTIETLEKNGVNFEIKHICNSIALFRFPEMQLNAVRAGSALIGRVSPICGNTGLKKVGTLFAKITEIRTLPKGHNIGYAALYKTKKEQNVGYADGIAVTKSNDSFRFIDILRYGFNDLKLLINPTELVCKIGDKTAKNLGRIGMTNLVLDATNVENAQIGDLVEVPANPIYLSPLIKRVYK